MTQESDLVQLIIDNFQDILTYLRQQYDEQYDELPPELKKVVEIIPDFLSDIEMLLMDFNALGFNDK